MSTRGTYSFETSGFFQEGRAVTFYIHHDNYPEGAAVYFWIMHKGLRLMSKPFRKAYKGGKAEVFMKANFQHVEFTGSHDSHGDTEYQYHLACNGELTAKKVEHHGMTRVFKAFFKGHYAEFINQYCGALANSNLEFEKLHKIEVSEYAVTGGQKFLTLSEIEENMDKSYEELVNNASQRRFETKLLY